MLVAAVYELAAGDIISDFLRLPLSPDVTTLKENVSGFFLWAGWLVVRCWAI